MSLFLILIIIYYSKELSKDNLDEEINISDCKYPYLNDPNVYLVALVTYMKEYFQYIIQSNNKRIEVMNIWELHINIKK